MDVIEYRRRRAKRVQCCLVFVMKTRTNLAVKEIIAYNSRPGQQKTSTLFAHLNRSGYYMPLKLSGLHTSSILILVDDSGRRTRKSPFVFWSPHYIDI